MTKKFNKPALEVKNLIYFWFFKYHNKKESDFNGDEDFTLFKLLDTSQQDKIKTLIKLEENEIPVLALKIPDSQYIINTTNRFIKIDNLNIENLYYKDFKWHKGFKSIIAETLPSGKNISIKTDGYYSEFGLTTIGNKTIFWKIPTGVPGFGFWNVTKKVELIGRKYIITE